MCGIAGIVVSQLGELDLRSMVEQMQSRLTHRGPDDRGMFVSDNGRCALAHTRLSILDLSPAGHQPMGMVGPNVRGQRSVISDQWSAGARYWIAFNGEIYNFRQLRKELGVRGEASAVEVRGKGSEVDNQRSDIRDQKLAATTQATRQTRNANTWVSNSDTEVILRAYERWGLDCLKKLRGMFAFAIWDNQNEELILARDPFGIKPLYYYQNRNTFIFSSEVRALLASGLVPRRLSRDGLVSYLQFGSVQDPLTMIEGVRSLLPGYCLIVKHHQNTISLHESRFSHSPVSEYPVSDRREAVTTLRKILEESVRQHLVSDVPVGAFLSGGIDSSGIVALMSRVTNQKLKTFSVVFKEAEFSEATHARLVAQRFGSEHREIMLSENDLLELLPSALGAMDQPTMDGVNTYVVSKAVRDAGMKIALSGLGGDELFAGYPSFHRAQRFHRLAIMPFAIRQVTSTLGRSFLNGSARNRKIWDMFGSDCSPYAAYSLSRQLFSPSEISALTRGGVRGQSSEVRHQSGEQGARSTEQFEIRNYKSEIGESPHASRLTSHDFDVINEVSRLELCGYMNNTLLRDTDQMSMAHALEVRVPFVDPVVVNFVLGLPGNWKVDGSRPKPLLVDALGDLLPEEIWKRRKMGFTLPFQRWLRADLQNPLGSTFNDMSRFKEVGLDSKAVNQVWEDFCVNPNHVPWSRPWSLYVLKTWCDLNGIKSD